MTEVDLLIVHAEEIATPAGRGPRRGPEQDELLVVRDGALAVRGGRIEAVGPTAELAARYRAPTVHDARGCFLVPGFVDAHTHPAFVATREREYDLRLRGVGYEEITRRGGGIFRSVDDLRAADDATLAACLRGHLRGFLAAGATTVECKSGYGLTWRDERRSLELLAREAAALPLRVVPTFLGAHQMPREFKERRADYVRELATQMLPEVKRLGLARYCDVFCDVGAFTVEEARAVLAAARDLGLGLRIHAEELGPSGGARLAAELRADSADHLIHVDDATIDAMGAAGVAPVLLPGTVFALAKSPPPARRMIERGLPVALATDFNPGTSYLQSPLLLIALACGVLRLTVAQALTGATANAAASLRLQDECGALLPGLSADAVLIRGSSHLLLGYRMSEGPIERVLARGQLLDPRDFSPFASTKGP
ncbi:MAG: imidazolonepropionase [Planctomycetes bacterium]|nr:imidazolonepropionase [Planctomycetota bacterium]